jgi:hypothetical protein
MTPVRNQADAHPIEPMTFALPTGGVMLAYHLNAQTGIVELRPRGRLEAQVFASLALTVDSYIEDHG